MPINEYTLKSKPIIAFMDLSLAKRLYESEQSYVIKSLYKAIVTKQVNK